MKIRTLYSTILALIFLIGLVKGQSVEEETGFKYVKGNYLFDSGRFDEAIQVYNDIIKGDAAYEDVLVYRARAKYALGAYKGTKRDGLAFIELNGLTEEVCLIMGQAELGLGNPLVAISYLDYAIMKNPRNVDGLLFRGNAYFEIDDDVAACTDWYRATRLGSDRADQQSAIYCRRVNIPEDDIQYPDKEADVVQYEDDGILEDDEVVSSNSETSDEDYDDVLSGDEVLSTDDMDASGNESASNAEDDYIFDSSDDLDEEFPEEDPIFDDEPLDIAVEIIEVDEDLDIKIYDGIGSREIREIPDILILSDKEGQVVVDICIDQSGNVSSASLNRKKSTVSSAGLISLALRKSREFKFSRTKDSEQCGKIAFLIK